MEINKLHEEKLYQLTGCRYPTIVFLEKALAEKLLINKLGAPLKCSIRTILVVTLIKLRSDNAYRTLAIYLGIPHVSLNRYVRRTCIILSMYRLNPGENSKYLIVDGTCTRIRSTDVADYSGYKHHKNRKVQVIINDKGRVVAVSNSYNGSIHDKTIWNKEYKNLVKSLNVMVLADKAYAGAKGENVILFRPIRRNETTYKTDKESCKSANRELSKKRVKIEHVFAKLKSFRILRDIFLHSPKMFSIYFKTVALIHNISLEQSY